MPNDSIAKIVLVALGVCLVCSLLVSTAAVALSDRIAENQRLDRIKNILQAGGLLDRDTDVGETYEQKIKPELIELASGKQVEDDTLGGIMTTATFDLKEAASDPTIGEAIPADQDVAGISRKPKCMVVYIVQEEGALDQVILPVYGKGLWSTMYGFLALKKDIQKVSGITFYSHGETPGLGGEIDNPRWQGAWPGKQALDADGKVVLTVIKGAVDPGREEAKRQVDGLSGATLTTRGLDNMVQFWLGPNGYGPYLARLRSGGGAQ